MPWTIENALSDDLITMVHRDDDFGVYEFRVGSLETVVTVEVRRLPTSEAAVFTRSHSIKAPGQAGAYKSSRPYWDDIPYALHQAIDGITSYYRAAIKEGHVPKESWLVEG